MEQTICCICKTEVKSEYGLIKHLDNGKSRIYKGHKRCLLLVDTMIKRGEYIEFEEIDTPKLPNKHQKRR